jgi:hypothetical protein
MRLRGPSGARDEFHLAAIVPQDHGAPPTRAIAKSQDLRELCRRLPHRLSLGPAPARSQTAKAMIRPQNTAKLANRTAFSTASTRSGHMISRGQPTQPAHIPLSAFAVGFK